MDDGRLQSSIVHRLGTFIVIRYRRVLLHKLYRHIDSVPKTCVQYFYRFVLQIQAHGPIPPAASTTATVFCLAFHLVCLLLMGVLFYFPVFQRKWQTSPTDGRVGVQLILEASRSPLDTAVGAYKIGCAPKRRY